MTSISFFTPVAYPSPRYKNYLLEVADDYFYLGGKKFYQIKDFNYSEYNVNEEGYNRQEVILLDSKLSLLKTALKIISYGTVVIPLIMLIAKAILRSQRNFICVDLNQKIENKQLIGEALRDVTSLIPLFNPADQKEKALILKIAKLAAAQDGNGVSRLIKNYGFDPKTPQGRSTLVEIAKIAAAESGAGVSCHIKNYGFDTKTPEGRVALLEIAKTAAARNGFGVSLYIKHYRFDAKTPEGKAALLKIARITIKGDDYEKIALNFGHVISLPELSLFEKCENLNDFALGVEKNRKDLPLTHELFSEVLKFKNEHAKLQALPHIAYINFLLAASHNKELPSHVSKWKTTFIELIKTRDPKLRFHLASQVIALIEKNPQRKVQGLLEATLQGLYDQKGSALQAKTVLDLISKKDLKDASLQKTLLWTFFELSQDKSVSDIATQKALEEAAKKGSRSEILNELRKIRTILNLKGSEQLEKQQDLNAALQKLVQEKYPGFTDGIPHLGDALSRTFLTSRNPYALFTYAACLATLPGNPLAAPLSTFFKSVLNGTFKETRQTTENNPHLQALKEKHPEIVETWFKGDKLKDYKLGKREEEVVIPVHMILNNALVRDNHFPDVDPLVLAVLNGSKDRTAAMQEVIAKIRAQGITKIEQEALAVTRDLLRLLDPELKEEQRKAVIDQLIKKLPVGAELIHDLNSLMPKKALSLETVTLTDTDDPYDILLCGSEVDGSCQRVDGSPNLNQGLLGYLLNGQTRLLALKHGDSADIAITARAIIRLQFNQEGKPVMLMERIYPQTLSNEMRDALVDFALTRATALGVDLVSVEEGDPNDLYPGALRNLGGVAAEYVDSASGIRNRSYEVNGAKRIRR